MAYSVLNRNIAKYSVVIDISSVSHLADYGNLNPESKFYPTFFFHYENKLENKT